MRHTVSKFRLGPRFFLLLPPLGFLALFYFYPLWEIFALSLWPRGQWDLAGLRRVFASPGYLEIVGFTFWQAALSTLLTLMAALPGAYVFARFRFAGKQVVQAFTTIPFVLPTVVVAAAFRALLGRKGLINTALMAGLGLDSPPIQLDHSLWIILLAHVFYNYTVVLRIVGGFWAQLDPRLAEGARMLGASPWQSFCRITLPLLGPAVFAAALLVFVFCFCSFGVILILGGPRFATLEVAIYRQAVHLFNLPLAAILSLIQILFTFGLMWIYTGLQRRFSQARFSGSGFAPPARPVRWRERLMVWANLSFILGFLGLPLLALVLRSLSSPDGLTPRFYQALFENPDQSIFFVPPWQAVANSLGFAGLTLVAALILGGLAAGYLAGDKGSWGGFLDPLFMLPLSTSAVTLGFGFIIALDRPPLDLRGSIWLVPIGHSLVAFPFVVRSLLPALKAIPRQLQEAARILGAAPWQVRWHVDRPLMARALIVGAVFAFTVSLGEFGATVFIARPQTPTMPLAIYRFLGQPGSLNYGQAMAMSSLLMGITAVGFLFLERLRIRGGGEF